MTVPSLFTATTDDAVTADQFNTYELTCDTYADLRAFVGTTGQEVYARGRSAVGDGYQGAFYWAAASTGTDDNLTIITPTGQTTGRWLRSTPYSPGVAGMIVSAPVAVNFPSTSTGRSSPGDVTIPVTGAVVGDFAMAIGTTVLAAGGSIWAVVEAAGLVTVYYQNLSGGTIDPASMTVYALVIKRS